MASCRFCPTPVMIDGWMCQECNSVASEYAAWAIEVGGGDVDGIASAIGIPADEWGGQCHGISLAFRAAGCPGRVRRGWITALGYGGQHSWIELPRDIVVDPTITALQGKPTSVRVTSGMTGYDPCGWRTMHANVRPCPHVTETERDVIELSPLGSWEYVANLVGHHGDDGVWCGDDDGGWLTISVEQAAWLAHLPVINAERAGHLSSWFAAEVYEALDRADQKAWIPVDAWHYVMDVPYPHEPARVKAGAR